MQIATKIEVSGGRYRVQIETLKFSALEDQKLAEFGEPTIDVGSVISGSASRPNEVNTTAVISPVGAGSGATGVVAVNAAGQVTGVTITSGGSGYTSGATIAFHGDGTEAAGTVTVASGVVTGVTITEPGEGYSSVPHPISVTLAPALRRIRSDFPIVAVFDTEDYLDADVLARVYANVIVERLTAAKTALVNQAANFEGEFIVTV